MHKLHGVSANRVSFLYFRLFSARRRSSGRAAGVACVHARTNTHRRIATFQAEHFARAKKVLAAEVQRLRSQVGEGAAAPK